MRHDYRWADGLDDDRIRTLALVVAGLTDEAAAHRLGVSKRTVQRRIRELMDLSGARNRMELGHRAALAGLPFPLNVRAHPPTAPRRSRASMPHVPLPHSGRAGSGRADDRRPKPDESDLVLLRELLVDGAPEVVLGVSSRSVERRVHALMARAGAASRAQLGWRATCEGWL
jgi:DNA-binding CsgD family transcriptional regulator